MSVRLLVKYKEIRRVEDLMDTLDDHEEYLFYLCDKIGIEDISIDTIAIDRWKKWFVRLLHFDHKEDAEKFEETHPEMIVDEDDD